MGHKIQGRRSFKIIASTNPDKSSGGRYMAENAYGAGRKAATKLFQGTSLTDVKFVLKESTLRSDKNTYMYIAHRVKLSKPRVVSKVDKVTGKKIEYKVLYDVQLSELPEAQAGDLMTKAGLTARASAPPAQEASSSSSFDAPPAVSFPAAPAAKNASPAKGKGKGKEGGK